MISVLIVEDELIPADYLRRMLKREGYEVLKTIPNGKDAIDAARKLHPEIILMDIMLADGVSGTQAALQIRTFLPDVIMIFLTAFSDSDIIDEALESNAYAYLIKPYRDKEIIATMRMASQHLHSRVEHKKALIDLIDGYQFELHTQRLFREDKEIGLGPIALRLIGILCNSPHSSLSHEHIIIAVWGRPVSAQTLRSLVHRIRQMTHKDLIINVNKSGYTIGLESSEA